MRASEFWFFRINYLCTIHTQDGNGIKTGYAFDLNIMDQYQNLGRKNKIDNFVECQTSQNFLNYCCQNF
mgnify:CR=1 FL=1